MKFSVGYQLFYDDEFIRKIIEYKDGISEVYFSFGDFPNGRNSQHLRADMSKEEAQEKQISDLALLADENIPLNILFNATCYGKDSLSKDFFQKVGDTVDYFVSDFTLKTVTTTSPVIAKFIKDNFDALEVRASVNMGIGSEFAAQYVSNYFDSFYLKRELNINLNEIRKMRRWCDENGKTLYLLANSGCLNDCSLHTFHDNLVSHEAEILKTERAFNFYGACRDFISNPGNLNKIFDCTNFIRPEDVHLYEGLVSGMKLATRVNANPVRVLLAYLKHRKHVGSVFDLCEPNHTSILSPFIIENSRIESDFSNDILKYKNPKGAIINVNERND